MIEPMSRLSPLSPTAATNVVMIPNMIASKASTTVCPSFLGALPSAKGRETSGQDATASST